MKALFILTWFLSATIGAPGLPEDPVEYAAWEAKMLKAIGVQKLVAESDDVSRKWRDDAISKIESLNEKSTIDEVLRVSGYLRIAERGSGMNQEHREVFDRVQQEILGIPNHAELFKEAIERGIQNEFKEAQGKGRSAKEPDLYRTFASLKQLPSAQVVRLLGDLLDDDRDPWVVVPAGEVSSGRPPPNSHFAARTLNQIGIVGVPLIEPLNSDRDHEAARDQWKLWYAQVKAGNRTFRFKGDPREYNLDGPVPAVGVATRPQKTGPSKSEEGSRGDEEGRGSGVPWGGVGAALGLLLLAGYACLRSMRRKGEAEG